MSREPKFASEYRHFMKEYELLGHMRLLNGNLSQTSQPDLSHHGIWQQADQSEKLRVVFDAFCKTSSGVSLNDVLYPRLALQIDLTFVFLLWRLHRIAMTADMEKMYRQILVDQQDVDSPRVIWKDPRTGSEKLSTPHTHLRALMRSVLGNSDPEDLATDEGQ